MSSASSVNTLSCTHEPVCARVIAHNETGVIAVVHGQTFDVPCSERPALGAWARIHLVPTPTLIEVVNDSGEACFNALSDWSWFQQDRGRRYHYLVARAQIMSAVRTFFAEHRFLEVETPCMVPSPGLDTHLSAFKIEHASTWLSTSPEYQMKRLLSAGFANIFQITKSFRHDEQGQFHNAEFSMLEWYRAPGTVGDVIGDTEMLVHTLVKHPSIQSLIDPDLAKRVTTPWQRLSVKDAFALHAKCNVDDLLPDETAFYDCLTRLVEPRLGQAEPTVLVDYPASMASLARLNPANPRYAERFEVYINGIELCNGFGELTDAREQRTRLQDDQKLRRAQNKPVYPIDEHFLHALEAGLPPCAGNALGLDRLLMILLAARSIDDVMTFSQHRL